MDYSAICYSIPSHTVYPRAYPLQVQPQLALEPPSLPPSPQQVYHRLPMYLLGDDRLSQDYFAATSSALRHSIFEDPIASPPRSSHSPSSVSSYHSDFSSTGLSQVSDDRYSLVPRLPPILQVEKHAVTTTATQAASASRRRNEAKFQCPVSGCKSTFTRRFNLKGHLRSHTSERPYVCEWAGCGRAFARKHDCKRHFQLHSSRIDTHLCHGCGRSFSRMDALNRHLRSENGAECRVRHQNSVTGDACSSSVTGTYGSPGHYTWGSS